MKSLFHKINQNKKLSLAANLFLIFFSLFFSIILGEIILRAFWNPIPPLVETSSLQGLMLPSYPDFSSFTPNSSTYVTSRTCEFTNLYQINSLEMRDREHPLRKQNGVKRILFIGDSFTEGVGVEQDQTYPYLVQEQSQGEFECFNAGIRGTSPSQAYFRLKKYLNEGLEPDAVVVQFFSNDFRDDQKHTQQYNLRIENEQIVRGSFSSTAGGPITKVLGPFALPFYKTRLFLITFALLNQAPVIDPYRRSFSPEQGEQVLEFFKSSGVNDIQVNREKEKITLHFPILPQKTLTEHDLHRLWLLLSYSNMKELNLSFLDTVENPPPRDSFDEKTSRSLSYIDCILSLCRKNNLPLAIYYAPAQNDGSNQTAKIFSRWCIDNNVPFVFPLKEIVEYSQSYDDVLFYPLDGHIAPAGNQIVAKQIFSVLKVLLD